MQDTKENNGLVLHYSGGDYCDEIRDYDVTITIKCDQQATVVKNPVITETHTCFKHVTFSHQSGCKIDQLSALWSWAQRNYIVIAVPLILFGLMACFQGIAFIKQTYLGCGIILTVASVWYVFYTTFLEDNTLNTIGWAVFVGSVLGGLIVGWFLIKIPKLGPFILGAIGGFCLGALFFNCVLYLTNSYWILYSVSLGLGLLNGLITLYQSEALLIHSSSLVGSYFIMMGVGMLAGSYDNPFVILDLIRFEEQDSVDPGFYGYFAGNIVLYIIGIFSQFRKLKQMKASRRLAFKKHGLN